MLMCLVFGLPPRRTDLTEDLDSFARGARNSRGSSFTQAPPRTPQVAAIGRPALMPRSKPRRRTPAGVSY